MMIKMSRKDYVFRPHRKSLSRISQVSFIIYNALRLEWEGFDDEGLFIDFFHRREVLALKRCGFTNFRFGV